MVQRSNRVNQHAGATWRTMAAALALAVPALALSGCGPSRDEVLSEKLAAAEAAARRAEAAQKAAERAAASAARSAGQPVAAIEAEEEVADQDAEPANQNPDSGAFDNTIVSPAFAATP